MKTNPTVLSLAIGIAALVLPLFSQAAPVTWGTATNITAASNIDSSGLTTIAGANFGVTTGTTTIVNNGSVDVEFKSLNSNQNVTLSNGINVAAGSAWVNWGNNGGNSNMSGTWGVVLDTNLGMEPGDPTSATITLSNLVVGTQYRIQFFASATASNTETIAGSGTLNAKNGGYGQFVTGTFTADATSQALTVTRTTNGFAVANALTVGDMPGGSTDTTPPTWISGWPKVDSLTIDSFTVRAKTNEAGTAYYVVLAGGATAPSAAQVKAGTDSTGAPAFKSNNMVLSANTEATASVTGLTRGTTYDVYFVAEDAVPNLQAAPAMVSATTPSKSDQTITFALGNALTKAPGSAPFADTATATSGLPVTYDSDNTDVATVDESGTVTIVAAGTAHILANQVGDDNWNAAPQVSQTLTVALISNGGFEINTGHNGGDATDWIKDGAYGIESGYNGGWAFNSGGGTSDGFYQTLPGPLVAGLKYQLTYYLATWAAGNQMNVRVGKYVGGSRDADGSYSPLPLSAIDTNPTGPWAAFSHTFTAQGGEDTLYFGATGIQPGDPGGKYDNVVLSVVPFTLSYDANGGTGTAPGPFSQNLNTTITTAPAETFTRDGYSFDSWNTAADGSGTIYAAGATFTFTADTTLYARWNSTGSNYNAWAAAQSPPLVGGPDAAGADGLKNLLIYAIDGLNTNHTNGSPGVLNPATNELSFTKRPDAITNGDVSWAIETSPDLEHWTTQVNQPKGDPNATISCILPAGAGKIFARLHVNQ